MVWLWVLAFALFIVLKIKFPNYKKPYKSLFFLFSLSFVLQFQNCGDTGEIPGQIRATKYSHSGVYCDPIGSIDDPNCQDQIDGCDPQDPNCTDPAYLTDVYGNYCIPIGKRMPSGDSGDPDYVPPCNPSAIYCIYNGRATLAQNCK